MVKFAIPGKDDLDRVLDCVLAPPQHDGISLPALAAVQEEALLCAVRIHNPVGTPRLRQCPTRHLLRLRWTQAASKQATRFCRVLERTVQRYIADYPGCWSHCR